MQSASRERAARIPSFGRWSESRQRPTADRTGFRSASDAAEDVVAAGERRAPHPTAECAEFRARGVSSGTAHSLLFALVRHQDARRKRTMRLDMPVHRTVAAIVAFSLAAPAPARLVGRHVPRRLRPTPATPASPGQPPLPSRPQPDRSLPPAAAAAAPIDGGWPRMHDLPSGGTILVYQPQIASWDKQTHMVAFSAVSYRGKTAEKPALGTIKLEADTKVALTERLVSFEQMRIVEANFQTLPKERCGEVVAQIDKTMSNDERVIALDRVLANIDKSQIVVKNVEGIKADPPTIFFSKSPAVIVNLDGEPIWSPIKDNDLKFAVNTNWDLFQHEPSATYYLRNDDSLAQEP